MVFCCCGSFFGVVVVVVVFLFCYCYRILSSQQIEAKQNTNLLGQFFVFNFSRLFCCCCCFFVVTSFFLLCICVNTVAIYCAIISIVYGRLPFWLKAERVADGGRCCCLLLSLRPLHNYKYPVYLPDSPHKLNNSNILYWTVVVG